MGEQVREDREEGRGRWVHCLVETGMKRRQEVELNQHNYISKCNNYYKTLFYITEDIVQIESINILSPDEETPWYN